MQELKLRPKQLIDYEQFVRRLSSEPAVMNDLLLQNVAYVFQTDQDLFYLWRDADKEKLQTYLNHEDQLQEQEVCFYIKQIAIALSRLHEQDVIYGDIALNNIFLDSEGYIDIVAFELA